MKKRLRILITKAKESVLTEQDRADLKRLHAEYMRDKHVPKHWNYEAIPDRDK